MSYRLRLWAVYGRYKLKEKLEYRGAFLLGLFAQALRYAAQFLVIWMFTRRFQSIAGWELPELSLLYSLELFTYGLAAALFHNPMVNLERDVANGKFDITLIRPLHPLESLILSRVHLDYIAHVGVAGTILWWALSRLNVQWTPFHVLSLLLGIIGAVLIQAAMLVIVGAMAFRLMRAQFFPVVWDIKGFVAYPISIYNAFLQFVLTMIIPYAFVNYFPAAALLNRTDETVFPATITYFAPAVGLLCFWLTYKWWYRGLNLYQGAGS